MLGGVMNATNRFSPATAWKAAVVLSLIALVVPPLVSIAGPGFAFSGDHPSRDCPPPGGEFMDVMAPPPGPHPVLILLDADGDRVLSASEIADAAKVILAMDANQDGVVDEQELAAALPPPLPSGGPEGAEFAIGRDAPPPPLE